jgi:hypothetical protein
MLAALRMAGGAGWLRWDQAAESVSKPPGGTVVAWPNTLLSTT